MPPPPAARRIAFASLAAPPSPMPRNRWSTSSPRNDKNPPPLLERRRSAPLFLWGLGEEEEEEAEQQEEGGEEEGGVALVEVFSPRVLSHAPIVAVHEGGGSEGHCSPAGGNRRSARKVLFQKGEGAGDDDDEEEEDVNLADAVFSFTVTVPSPSASTNDFLALAAAAAAAAAENHVDGGGAGDSCDLGLSPGGLVCQVSLPPHLYFKAHSRTHHPRRNSSNNNGTLRCAVILLLALAAQPFAAAFMTWAASGPFNPSKLLRSHTQTPLPSGGGGGSSSTALGSTLFDPEMGQHFFNGGGGAPVGVEAPPSPSSSSRSLLVETVGSATGLDNPLAHLQRSLLGVKTAAESQLLRVGVGGLWNFPPAAPATVSLDAEDTAEEVNELTQIADAAALASLTTTTTEQGAKLVANLRERRRYLDERKQKHAEWGRKVIVGQRFVGMKHASAKASVEATSSHVSSLVQAKAEATAKCEKTQALVAETLADFGSSLSCTLLAEANPFLSRELMENVQVAVRVMFENATTTHLAAGAGSTMGSTAAAGKDKAGVEGGKAAAAAADKEEAEASSSSSLLGDKLLTLFPSKQSVACFVLKNALMPVLAHQAVNLATHEVVNACNSGAAEALHFFCQVTT